ncbi:hypothetical protein BCR35DRAFT_328655 [Leucosporidium creatinivorum]|uniref:Uncharacterized protein n=1 Tax=Leucosporidium creatinivorum TaxID=106004 RepID=A0A1Y2G5W9_9BASI|nr:hypothetical protein BCR35DRAFT_328655 [Leucosporidium creatinivorum]
MSALLKRFKAGSSPTRLLTGSGKSEPAFLSPWALWQHSFLAGSTLIVGAAVIVLDVSCIICLSYAYGYTHSLSLDTELVQKLPGSPLRGLASSILATAFWYGMQLCLTMDMCLALCTTSRELQEGSVYAYGVVSVWQIPLMAVCLSFELSNENKTWIISACELTSFRPSCTDWWNSVRAAAIAPTIIASLFHATFFLFAFIFCRTRSAKSLRPPKEHRKLHKVPDDIQYPYDHRGPNPNKPIKPVPPPAGYSDSDLDDEERPPSTSVLSSRWRWTSRNWARGVEPNGPEQKQWEERRERVEEGSGER